MGRSPMEARSGRGFSGPRRNGCWRGRPAGIGRAGASEEVREGGREGMGEEKCMRKGGCYPWLLTCRLGEGGGVGPYG